MVLPVSKKIGDISKLISTFMGLCQSKNSTQIVVSDNSKSVEIVEKQPVYNLLVVDDVELNSEIIANYLEILEYEGTAVHYQASGNHALQFVDNHDVQVVLMDIKMLPMDGYQTTRLLREKGYTGLIIGVSGMVDRIAIDKAIEAGMNATCPKPLDIDQLIKTIEDHGYELIVSTT